MRILMAVPHYPYPVVGGLERQAHELATALAQRGHVVHAVSSRFHAEQDRIELIDGVRIHRTKWVMSRPGRFLLQPFSVASTLVELRRDVDLVHVHCISSFGLFVTVVAKALGLPVVSKLMNIGEFGVPGMRRRAFGWLRIAVLKKSDAIIAMTPDSVAELAGIGYPQAQVLRVPNGIRLLETATGGGTPQHYSSDSVTAIFVGRLFPQKGLTDLLRAWATVKKRASCRVKLRIVGDGAQQDELRALAAALGLGDAVEFLGHRGDVPAELAKADLFVLPSYAEGNSNAILEAMRAGLAIVATRVGGAPIQVGNQGDRWLVPPGDRQALADRLLELVEDAAIRHRLGAAMRARVQTVFAIDEVAATYERAYELILSGHCDRVGSLNPDLFSQSDTKATSCAE